MHLANINHFYVPPPYRTTLKLCCHALYKMKKIIFLIVGCFSCERVHLLNTKEGNQHVAVNFRSFGRNIAVERNFL